MNLSRLLFAGIAFATPALASNTALANYVCDITWEPRIPYGSKGSLNFSVYTGYSCGGNFVGSYRVCGVDATSNSCPNAPFLYSEVAIQTHFLALRSAIMEQQWIDVATTPCKNGAGGCFAYMTLRY
jgi:hypothetical protein